MKTSRGLWSFKTELALNGVTNKVLMPNDARNYLGGCLGPRKYSIFMYLILGYERYIFFSMTYVSHAVMYRMVF